MLGTSGNGDSGTACTQIHGIEIRHITCGAAHALTIAELNDIIAELSIVVAAPALHGPRVQNRARVLEAS